MPDLSRRAFLGWLALAPVITPTLLKGAVKDAAASILQTVEQAAGGAFGWVSDPRWWIKEFDWGHTVGVAMEVIHPQTGEPYRNAVRMNRCQHPEHLAIWPNWSPGVEGGLIPVERFSSCDQEAIQIAQQHLTVWSEEKAMSVRLIPCKWCRKGVRHCPHQWGGSAVLPTPTLGHGVVGDEVLEGNEQRLTVEFG